MSVVKCRLKMCVKGEINYMVTAICQHDIHITKFYVVSEEKPYPSLVERWTVLLSWPPGTGPTPLIYTWKTKIWVRPLIGRQIFNRDLSSSFANSVKLQRMMKLTCCDTRFSGCLKSHPLKSFTSQLTQTQHSDSAVT